MGGISLARLKYKRLRMRKNIRSLFISKGRDVIPIFLFWKIPILYIFEIDNGGNETLGETVPNYRLGWIIVDF